MDPFFKISITIGIFSFVYTYILTRPMMILNGIYNRLDTFFKTDERASKGKGAHWLFMIIMYCEKCNSGQISLWSFLYYFALPYYFSYGILITFACLCGFITLAIFTASVAKGIYIKYIEE